MLALLNRKHTGASHDRRIPSNRNSRSASRRDRAGAKLRRTSSGGAVMGADRELLELAAKAAGVKVFSYIDSEMFGTGINSGEVDVPLWNPLTDDGDALRLALKLGIQVWRDDDILWVDGNAIQFDDIEAEARRAIVRAAAAIGKAMP